MSLRNKGLSKLQGTPWHIEYLRKPESEKGRTKPTKGYGYLDLGKHFPPDSPEYEYARNLFRAIEQFEKVRNADAIYSEFQDAKKLCSKCIADLNRFFETDRFRAALNSENPVVKFTKMSEVKAVTIQFSSKDSPTLYDKTAPLSFYRFVEYAQSNGFSAIVQSDWMEKFRDAYQFAGVYAIYHVFRNIDSAILGVNPSPEICTAARAAIKKNGDFDIDAVQPFLQAALDSVLYTPKNGNNQINVYRICSADCKRFMMIPRLSSNTKLDLRFPKSKDSTVADACFSALKNAILYTP